MMSIPSTNFVADGKKVSSSLTMLRVMSWFLSVRNIYFSDRAYIIFRDVKYSNLLNYIIEKIPHISQDSEQCFDEPIEILTK